MSAGVTLGQLRMKKGVPALRDDVLIPVWLDGKTYAATIGELRDYLLRGKK